MCVLLLIGGISFGCMVLMCLLLFWVICVFGFNDGDFLCCDLVVGFNQFIVELDMLCCCLGDCFICEDDCFLFLQLFVVVQEVFYFSYFGVDLCDGSVCELLVLVSELIDVVVVYYFDLFVVVCSFIVCYVLQLFLFVVFGDGDLCCFSYWW